MCHNHDKKICETDFFLDLWRSSFVGLAISSTVRNCVLGIAHYRILVFQLFLSQRPKRTRAKCHVVFTVRLIYASASGALNASCRCQSSLCHDRSLSALRELKRALDEGFLSSAEFTRYKISVLDGEEETLSKWEVLGSARPVSSELLQPLQNSISSLQQSVDTLLKRPQPDSDAATTSAPTTTRLVTVNDSRVDPCPPAKRHKTSSLASSSITLVELAAPRAAGQQSLFTMGVKVGHTRGDDRTVWLTETATRPTELRHKCPHRGCGLAFKRPCELANHRKSHQRTFTAIPLPSMACVQAQMNDAQLKAARDITVKFIVDSMIASAESHGQATVVGAWCLIE